MAWQKHVYSYVDKVRGGDLSALDEFSLMVEALVRDEKLKLVDAIASVAMVAAAGASGNEAKLREVTGCGPEHWGPRAVLKRAAPPTAQRPTAPSAQRPAARPVGAPKSRRS